MKIQSILAPPARRPQAKPRVLIVEDETIIVMLMEEILHGLGVDICAVASTAPEAERMAEAYRPDLALVDVSLAKGTSGVVAARNMQRRFGTPIIFLTGDASFVQPSDVTTFGHIQKPFQVEDLRSAVDAVLNVRGAA